MKQAILFFVTAVLVFGCQASTAQPVDINAIDTAVHGTAQAAVDLAQTMTASPPTASPFLADIGPLLQGRCAQPWQREGIAWQIRAYGLMELYREKGCRLPLLAPDGKHLAYVTLDHQADQTVYVDTVKILQIATEKVQDAYFAHETNFISRLEWSPTGQLIIREMIWEGPVFVLVYDLDHNSTITTMRLDSESELAWNPTGTACYAEHSPDYGATICIHELRGYDLADRNVFPDFYETFNIEKQENPLLGIPNGKTDDLAVEPFAWSQDGKYLWITITLLRQLENGLYYELGPRQAGRLELTEDKVAFTMLASDPNFDYSFEGSPVPAIVSSPYQPRRCPER